MLESSKSCVRLEDDRCEWLVTAQCGAVVQVTDENAVFDHSMKVPA